MHFNSFPWIKQRSSILNLNIVRSSHKPALNGVIMSDITKKMVLEIKKSSDNTLLKLWDQSSNINDRLASLIRAILLDEIKLRYPEESKAWISSDEIYNIDSPRFLMDPKK